MGEFAPSWFVPTQQAAPPAATSSAPPPPQRLWAYFMAARLFIALGLLALQVMLHWQGNGRWWLLVLCGTYLVATAAVLRWSRPARTDSFWSAGWAWTLWMDLAVFGVLQTFQRGGVNYTPLFVLPVLLASVLGPMVLALGSAAVATLVLLFEAFTSDVLRSIQSTTYIQGAITGAGLFLVALLSHQLATRLSREQTQARLNRALAETESQVNQLIVTGLSEGVLVLDANGRIWHANLAACHMLGAPDHTQEPNRLTKQPGWPALSAWACGVLALGQDAECEMPLPVSAAGPIQVLLRARVTHHTPATPIPPTCVVFMENLRDVQNRVRNAKLAAMGRVSAAVAHEIRNPLAAIAQANALLAEDASTSLQQRLTQIVHQNAERLGRTVNDILEVVRPPLSTSRDATPHLLLDDVVTQQLTEWMHLQPQGERLIFQPSANHAHVPFETEHLRRVLVNLLDNANRHASSAAHAIQLGTMQDTITGNVSLTVWSDGPALAPDVQQHLFEPFVSSHSRSSGLGLYICRELCARYGATLEYERTSLPEAEGNAFTLRWQAPYHP